MILGFHPNRLACAIFWTPLSYNFLRIYWCVARYQLSDSYGVPLVCTSLTQYRYTSTR